MRSAPVVAVLAGLLVAAGCAATPTPSGGSAVTFDVPAAGAAPTTTYAPTPEQEELFGPRVELPGGMLLKQIGKVAQASPADSTQFDANVWAWRLVVDEIRIDPECDQYMPEPTRGHLLSISVRVETSDEYDPMLDGSPLNNFEWSTIGPDGVSEASGHASCRIAEEGYIDLRPSAKYRAAIAIDTANPAGQLVLANSFVWEYPA